MRNAWEGHIRHKPQHVPRGPIIKRLTMRLSAGSVLCAAILLAAFLVTPAAAGFKEGQAAYERGEYRRVIKELRPLAQKGHAESLFILGVMALEGKGVKKDLKRAAKAFAGAAAKGHPKAQFLFATLHYQGWGVPKSFEKAAFWAQKSADQGEPEGQHLLGILYVKGEGVPRDYLQGEAWLTKAAAGGLEKAKDVLANLKVEIAKARKQGLIPTATQQASVPQSNVTEQLASSGTFRIPPAGTIATYQCTGGRASTVKYAIESVEGDTLTVKVMGDGEDFGTYRRKAWQMVGTTLYEELKYRQTSDEPSKKETASFSSIGNLQPNSPLKGVFNRVLWPRLAAAPIGTHRLALILGSTNTNQYDPRLRLDHFLDGLGSHTVNTKEFGTQSVVSLVGKVAIRIHRELPKWQSVLNTDFAPALGLSIRQRYTDNELRDVTCELASITGPGAAYIAMGSIPGGNQQQVATRAPSPAKPVPSPSLAVQQTVATDTAPPVLEVVETVATTGPVVAIEGTVSDQSAIAELSVQGVPVPLGDDGSFTIRRGVPVGESELTLAVVDVWGNVTERQVRVSRTLPQSQAPKLAAASQTATQTTMRGAATADTAPPVIETVAGLKTNLEVETISGRVTDASKVASFTIDGKSIALGADGGFSVERKLPVGESRVRMAAVDAHGNQAEMIVTILRKPHIPKVNYGTYHALIIGNADYQDLPKLQTAVVDAKAVAKILEEEYGFRVRLLTDVTRDDMIDAFDILREELGENDNLLVYYAGHGWLDEAAGRGYWQPVNAKLNRRSQWMSNATLTDSLKAKHVMVVADSCYSGVLTRSIKVPDRTIDYIERMASRRARVVLTSGGSGRCRIPAAVSIRLLRHISSRCSRTIPAYWMVLSCSSRCAVLSCWPRHRRRNTRTFAFPDMTVATSCSSGNTDRRASRSLTET